MTCKRSERSASLSQPFQRILNSVLANHLKAVFKRLVPNCATHHVFALFHSPDHLEKLTNYLNLKHKNITFTYEKKINNSLTLLHILISRSENGFKTSVYHKPTFSGIYCNFNSFIYDQYKIGLIFALLFRTFSILSDFSKFHMDVSHLNDTLRKKAFPIKLVDNCIKTFLNKKFLHTPVALIIEKKELFTALPYLGNLSLAVRTHLQNSINKNLPFCKIKVISKSTIRLSNFFHFKDKMPFNLRSNIVCKFSCGRCNAMACTPSPVWGSKNF